MISVKGLTKYYGNNKALSDVSFSVEKGEIFSLLGTNGAGKTTIIKMILGLLEFGQKDKGEIIVNNLNVKDKKKYNRDFIGYIPEERVLIEYLTGEEFIDFVASIYKKEDPNFVNKKNELLKLFNLDKRRKDLIKYYSNGMKKKTLITSALVTSPSLLIVDEPFVSLDPESIFIIKKLLISLSKKGCTILISSHSLDIMEDITDKVLILKEGKVKFLGTKNNLYEKCGTTDLESSYIKLVKTSSEVKTIESNIQIYPY